MTLLFVFAVVLSVVAVVLGFWAIWGHLKPKRMVFSGLAGAVASITFLEVAFLAPTKQMELFFLTLCALLALYALVFINRGIEES